MKFLGGRKYGRTVAWRIGLFLTLVIGFPFVVFGIAWLTGNVRSYSIIALVAGLRLRPLLLLLLLVSLMRPCLRRASALGFPAPYGLIIPLLIFADWQFLVVWATHWSVGFVLGVFALQPPVCAITALFLIALFSVAQPARVSSLKTRYGPFGRIVGTAVIALAVVSLAKALAGYFFGLVIVFGSPAIATPLVITLLLAAQGLAWLQILVSLVTILCLLVLIRIEWLRRSDPQGAPYVSA